MPELDQHGVVFDNHPQAFQADEGNEKTDANRSGEPQGEGDCLDDPFADAEPGQHQKHHPGEEDHAEGGLPGNALAEHQAVGEKGVETHAGRHHQRGVGPQGDEQGGEAGDDAGDGGQGALIHAGLREDCRVDEDDVGGGQKGGKPGEHFGADRGVAALEMKEFFQHGASRGIRAITSVSFLEALIAQRKCFPQSRGIKLEMFTSSVGKM